MDFLGDQAAHVGDFFTWISNPDSSIPVVKLLQGIAAVIGAIVTALGAYKTWRYAEGKLGERLTEFLDREEKQLALARAKVAELHGQQSARKQDHPVLFSNRELNLALKQVKKRKFTEAQTLLTEALERTKVRADRAAEKAGLHVRQKAMAHLLLGTIADSQHRNDEALAQFKAALDIDTTDVQALEYAAVQLLKLGHPELARDEFDKLAQLAQQASDGLLEARALRGIGKTWEPPVPRPSPSNANSAYLRAINVFPNDGPPLDIAYLHELRGMANLQLPNNRGQASKSLTEALVRYTRLQHASGREAKEGGEGVKRVNIALAQLQQPPGGVTLSDNTAALSAAPPAAGVLMGFGKFLGNQTGKSPPGDERAN
jgi:tetratricopeptide (TPR) repeat protein